VAQSFSLIKIDVAKVSYPFKIGKVPEIQTYIEAGIFASRG
jgi:hypothetical protein